MLELLLLLCLAAQPENDADRTQLRAEMHERFARATLIQTALISGNLEGARHWARQLQAMAPKDPDFADLRARFGALAAEIASARSLGQAAFRTGLLANACGACHELHGVHSFRFESTTTAPEGRSVRQTMARHIWAADRLWEGLVGRSEGSWTDGAAALVEAPLDPGEIGRAGDRQAEALAGQVRELGREALQTARWKPRATLYGRLLETCASCHQAYR